MARVTWISNRSTLLGGALALLVAASPAVAGESQDASICRGPGFWGTHGGSEKGGVNITQEVIDVVGCLEVCGEVIDDTDARSADSAIEAACVSSKAGGQLQLARQLLAHALNCVISTGSQECGDAEAWGVCNTACADPSSEEFATYGAVCRGYYSCINDGGSWDFETNSCSNGTCQLVGEAPQAEGIVEPCHTSAPNCAEGYECVPTEGCDDAALINGDLELDFTDDETKSSSSNACNRASKSSCAVVGSRETSCTSGTISEEAESCAVPCTPDGGDVSFGTQPDVQACVDAATAPGAADACCAGTFTVITFDNPIGTNSCVGTCGPQIGG